MRGLLAIEPLYHQIIMGRKTQTRRSGGLKEVNDTSIQMNGHQRSAEDCKLLAISFDKQNRLLASFDKPSKIIAVFCKSRYKIGEILFLKEPYVGQGGHYSYLFNLKQDSLMRRTIGWKNKMFMPADAGRNFIKITGIRCERLLDISDQDCIAEGIETCVSMPIGPERVAGYKNYLPSKNGGVDMLHSCMYYADMFPNRPDLSAKRSSFLSLYKFANKVKTINNIWVFCYEFEYLTNYQR